MTALGRQLSVAELPTSQFGNLLSLSERPDSAKSGRLSLEVINQWSSACLFHFCSF